MTTLSDRLRAQPTSDIMREAADEIDRLRDALEQIKRSTYLRHATALAETALDGKHWTEKS